MTGECPFTETLSDTDFLRGPTVCHASRIPPSPREFRGQMPVSVLPESRDVRPAYSGFSKLWEFNKWLFT